MNISIDQISKAFEAVSDSLQKAINASAIDVRISEICKEYNLHVDATGTLYSLTIMVCIGLLPAKDFVAEVQKTVPHLPQKDLIALIQKINTTIFEPIRQYEEKIVQQKKDAEAFERIVKKYEEAPAEQPVAPAPIHEARQENNPVTLADIASNTKPDIAKQKMTISQWKNKNVITAETQKVTVHNYTDKADPYTEAV